MITQILGYLALTNLNTSTTLKIRLSAIQHEKDLYPKQLLVSAATKLYKYTILITIIACLIIIYFSKNIFKENIDNITVINYALFIGAFGLIIEGFGSLYGSALRGNNLDYKGIGIRSFAFVISNIAIVIFIYLGGGLVSLAFATLLGSIFISLTWKRLTLKILKWYKIVSITTSYLKIYVKQSFLTLGHSIGNILLIGSDAILIGVVLGSKYAGFYFITIALIRSAILPVITTLVSSTGVGLANLINTQNSIKVKSITNEILQIGTILIGAGGILYILLNKNIVSHWVGLTFYCEEHIEVLFLILTTIQFSYSVIQYLTDGLQMFKAKARVSLIVGSIYIPTALILIYFFDLKGLIIAAISCHLMAIILLINVLKKNNHDFINIRNMIVRWGILLILFLGIDLFIRPFIPQLSIQELLILLIILCLFLGALTIIILPKSFKKRILINNPLKIKN